MLLLHHSGFHDRAEFGVWLNQQGLTKVGVEIGTHRGEFADLLLKKWLGKTLVAVDHWQPGYNPQDPASNGNREKDFEEARRIATTHRPRMSLIRATSAEATNNFEDDSLDFVYIDADHSYDSVISDLSLWWLKIKPGGVLAGHDIICPGEPDGWGAGIQRAVFETAERINRTVYLIPETLAWPWSYFFIK